MDHTVTFPILESLFPDGPARLALEWTGTVLGIAGAVLLALNGRHAKWGWPIWVVSNFCFVVFGLVTGAYGLATMQSAFMATSTLGCWKWIVLPYRAAAKPPRFESLPGDAS